MSGVILAFAAANRVVFKGLDIAGCTACRRCGGRSPLKNARPGAHLTCPIGQDRLAFGDSVSS